MKIDSSGGGAVAEAVVIEAEHLVKTYGKLTAVDGVSFQVRRGEVFGLLGPNGAGKTTTMEMLEGLRQPDAGRARVAGFDTMTQLDRVKAVIGVQLQSTSLFDLLTVREITEMYASFYETAEPVGPLLESVNLMDKANTRIKHLSGGQKQRLAIALALVNDPVVVFLDEPTTGLDPQARRSLWEIVRKLKEQGKTIVLSTHYMDEAHVLCERICLMDQGKVIALDAPDRLIERLGADTAISFRIPQVREQEADRKERLRAALAAVPAVKRIEEGEEGITLYTADSQAALTGLVAAVNEEGLQLEGLSMRTATLEDVFIQMTGRSLRE